MPSTYANDLRLEIIATGEQSGTWGDTTNDNLALIADALSYGAEDLSSDANATITMADGASDAVRSLYLKVTSSVSLTATRTITLAPNTVSKVWIIENATTGSQSITIKQGTGNTVTVANGAVKAVYSDGAGAGAAVNDALVDLDLTGISTIAALTIGGDGATVTGVKDEDNMSSDSAVKLATQQSIKAYVDSQVTAQDLDITTDSGSIDIDLDSESLTLAGGTGLDSSASSTTVTFAIDATVATLAGSQTLTNKTISGANNTISAYAGDSSLVTTGALDSGSITSGFGNINIGASTFTGALVGNVTGNVSGTAATVTGAAQAAITSLGTLTTLTVDDITINANTISSGGASTLAITPTAGQAITFDGTVTLDAGVIAGATSITSTAFVGALTGNASTATALETARTIGGVSFNGTAAIVPATITVADTTDTTSFVGLWESATGDLAPKTDAAITYNAGTGALTATTFVGALTGNASGTSATVTGATQASITTTANLVTVGALDSGSISSGFGNINNGSSTLTSGASTLASVNIASDGATVTGIKDEDNMASNSAVKLATQQSIKAYVDSSVATADTLSEVLALGNTTSGTDIAVSASDDITFTDSSKVILGSDGDLELYHDGSNGFIKNGTGDLAIWGAGNTVLKNAGGTETIARFNNNGAVTLYHDNAAKIATTATGVDVTGTVTATGTSVFASLDISGDIDVDGTTNLDVVDIDGAVDMASTLQVDGATTLSSALTVAAGTANIIASFRSTDANANIRFSDSNSTSDDYAGVGAVGDDLTLIAGNDNRARVTSAGNFGVGVIDPDVRVHVEETINVAYSADNFTTGANSLFKLENPSTTGNAFSAMQFRTGSGADLFFGSVQQSGNSGDFVWAYQDSTDKELLRLESTGDMIWYDDDGSTEKMRWDASTNRLGIGTSTPNNTLDVAGGIVCSPNTDGKDTFELSTSATDEGRLRIKNVDTTTVQIRAGGDTYFNGGNVGVGTTPAQLLHIKSAAPDLRIEDSDGGYVDINVPAGSLELRADQAGTQASSYISFYVDGGQKAVIDSSGRVGISRTPSTAYAKLEVGGADDTALINAEASGVFAGLGVSNGGLGLFESNAVKVTVKSGNVGIGTTSPNNTLVIAASQTSYAYPSSGNFIEVARTSGADAGYIINKDTGQWVMGIDNSDGSNPPLRFEYSAAGAAVSALGSGTLGLAIGYNGNVGIGIVPTHNFNVSGSGTVESRFASTDGKSSLQISSDTDEGQDSELAFYSGTSGRGSIIYDHHTTAASQKMVFKVGDVAVTAMTILGDGSITTAGDISPGADVIMASGRGISFTASSHAGGMTSELLDDYEEGTWTPAYSTSGGSFTYDAATEGWYTKIGNVVHVSFRIYTGTSTVGSGDVTIIGLPFTSKSVAFHGAGSIGDCRDWGGDTPDTLAIGVSSTNLQPYYRTSVNGSNTKVDASDMDAGNIKNLLDGQLTYQV
jgi:hypothetical protein